MKAASSKIHLGTKAAMASIVLMAAALAVPAAKAYIYNNTTGGASCHATSGANTPNLHFSAQSVQNIGIRSLYVTCDIPYFHPSPTPPYVDVYPPYGIKVSLLNPTGSTITFACSIQTGWDLSIRSSLYVVSVHSTHGVLESSPWTTPEIPWPQDNYSPYALTCLVPPQGKIGIISVALFEES